MPVFFQAVEPPPAAAAPSTITFPDWKIRPAGADMARVYPKAAQREELAGMATLACTVAKDGVLTGCTTQDEQPKGYGFGDAALKLAPVFQLRPMTRDGKPVDDGAMRIPIRFTTPPNLKAGPIEVQHASVKGETWEVNCRYRQRVLDNCIWVGPVEALRPIASQMEGAPFPAAPLGAGRVAISVKFKP